MASSIINVAKVLGPQLAGKLLGKVDSRFTKFFDNAVTHGFSLDQAMGFLVDRFGGKSSLETELAGRESKGELRPDEAAALQQVRGSRLPARVGQAALAYGLPFALRGEKEEETQETAKPLQIGTDVPISPTSIEDLRQKGGSSQTGNLALKSRGKLQPETGKYPDVEVESKLSLPHEDLFQYVQELINNGQSPEAAAGIAKTSSKWSRKVKDVERTTKKDFLDLVPELFGGSSKQTQPRGSGNQNTNQRSSRTQDVLQRMDQIGSALTNALKNL